MIILYPNGYGDNVCGCYVVVTLTDDKSVTTGCNRVVCVTWYVAFSRIHCNNVRVILCWIVSSVDDQSVTMGSNIKDCVAMIRIDALYVDRIIGYVRWNIIRRC